MPTQIQIKRGSTTPSGLTVGEQAVNTSTNQIYIGGTGGTVWVGGEVTAGVDMGAGSAVSATRVPTQSGVYNYVRNNFVTSFNGLTGAVGGVCAASANTFTALQSFNSGISANGGTFSVQLNAQNLRMLAVGGDEGGQIDFALPATNTTLTGGVAIDVFQDRLRIFESGGTNRGVFIDLSGVSAGVGTNLIGGGGGAVSSVSGSGDGISVSPTTGSVVVRNTGVHSFNGLTGAVTGVTVGGANVFTALNSFNAGISAAGGVTLSGTLSGATATFSNLVTGNGGFSGNVNISSTNATGNMYPVLSRGAGVTALFVDSATTPLVYQPLQGNLGLKGITLASGTDVLYATPTQITATSTSAPESAYFYFVSPTIYFQSGNTAAATASGSTRQLTWGDILNSTDNCYFGVNRAEGGMCGDYAVEINHSTGKALQLIYNDYTGAASNWVNMNVTSGGDLTITPSGGDATVSGNLSADSFILSSGGIKALTGTTYSFLAADNGKIITMSNAGGITAAIPTGLPVGFSVTVIQLGAGQVGFSADAGVTLNSYNSLKKIIGQHGSASVVIYSSNTANLAGSLT